MRRHTDRQFQIRPLRACTEQIATPGTYTGYVSGWGVSIQPDNEDVCAVIEDIAPRAVGDVDVGVGVIEDIALCSNLEALI